LAYDETAGLWKNIDIPPSAGVVTSSTPPAETSSIWFNTENGNTYIYYDDFWTSIAGSSGAPIISDTAPTDPVLGTQWFNSSTGKSYLYFSDAWIEIDSNGTSSLSTGNAIINGGFDIWQRGNTISTTDGLTADRWYFQNNKAGSVSRQTFTPGTAPLAGYEGTFFARVATTATGSFANLFQRIENVRTFAGQTVTLSFFARSVSGTTTTGVLRLEQNFGTGGSAQVTASGGSSVNLTSSWQRFTQTFTLPSIVGKTISANDSFLAVVFPSAFPDATAMVYDIWGVQLESGPVATPFRINANNIQGELAACQRYYQRWQADTNFAYLGGFINPSNVDGGPGFLTLFTPMRVKPTSVSFGNLALSSLSDSRVALTNVTINTHATASNGMLQFTTGSGLTAGTLYKLQANNSAAGFIALSAEL
jgi:hypothetical protein